MKTLSIKQPWISMILDGKKTMEVRTWKTNYRGDILLCASQSPKIKDAPFGVMVCVAEIYDCRLAIEQDLEFTQCETYRDDYVWCLRNIRPVKQVPLKGKLGLFETAPELIEFI